MRDEKILIKKSKALTLFWRAGLLSYYNNVCEEHNICLLVDRADAEFFRSVAPLAHRIYNEHDIVTYAAVLDCRAEALLGLDAVNGRASPGASAFGLRPRVYNMYLDGVFGYILKSPRYYSAPTPASLDTGYFILSTPRSGSTFLTDLLYRSGALGRPTEHLKPWLAQYLDLMGLSFDFAVKRILAGSRTPNGVFATKLIIDDLFTLAAQFGDEVFAWLRRAPVYMLMRADKSAQAFSNLRSNQLNLWHLYENTADAKRLRSLDFSPEFDDVFAKERWLLRQEADCLEKLRAEGVRPKLLSYEAIAQSRQLARAAIEEIAHDCGVEVEMMDGWSDLIRIGAATPSAPLDDYRRLRGAVTLYSTRSEPYLGKALGDGWGEVEAWGAWGAQATAEIVIPEGRDCAAIELVLHLPDGGAADIRLVGALVPARVEAGHGPEARLIFVLDAPRPGGTRLEVDLAGRAAAAVEIVFYQNLEPLATVGENARNAA